LLLVTFFTGCAPKIIPPAPPQYIEDFLLDEIVLRAGGDIRSLKAIADIRVEKNSEFMDQVGASVLVRRPDRAHMRIYKFGVLVSDLVMKDGELYFLSGKKDTRLAGLIDEFFHAVLWWDGVEDGYFRREGDEYVIQTAGRDIRLDRATLLPVRQDISSDGNTVRIIYSEPRDYEGFWYPSKLGISAAGLNFSVTVDKLIKNPAPGETDFKTPVKTP